MQHAPCIIHIYIDTVNWSVYVIPAALHFDWKYMHKCIYAIIKFSYQLHAVLLTTVLMMIPFVRCIDIFQIYRIGKPMLQHRHQNNDEFNSIAHWVAVYSIGTFVCSTGSTFTYHTEFEVASPYTERSFISLHVC